MRTVAAAILMGSLSLGVLGGCGSDPTAVRAHDGASPAYAYPGGAQEYETTQIVLSNPEHGPELCAGGVLLMLPPQCGGPAVDGWDWDAVGGFEETSGTRWGTYELRGTFEGERFTLTAAPKAVDPDGADDARDLTADRPGIPCAEPAGGWIDPSLGPIDDGEPLVAAARAEPDFGEVRIVDLDEHRGDDEFQDLAKVVFVVTFTGDLDRHETELRAIWPGPLCVAPAGRTGAELDAAQDRLMADVRDEALTELAGASQLDPLSAGQQADGALHVSVLVADEGLAERLTERYGVPIEVTPALRPVS
ncbi:MAG: hypothetical protein R2702_06040 [Acidimicrobiales bacterium]